MEAFYKETVEWAGDVFTIQGHKTGRGMLDAHDSKRWTYLWCLNWNSMNFLKIQKPPLAEKGDADVWPARFFNQSTKMNSGISSVTEFWTLHLQSTPSILSNSGHFQPKILKWQGTYWKANKAPWRTSDIPVIFTAWVRKLVGQTVLLFLRRHITCKCIASVTKIIWIFSIRF